MCVHYTTSTLNHCPAGGRKTKQHSKKPHPAEQMSANIGFQINLLSLSELVENALRQVFRVSPFRFRYFLLVWFIGVTFRSYIHIHIHAVFIIFSITSWLVLFGVTNVFSVGSQILSVTEKY